MTNSIEGSGAAENEKNFFALPAKERSKKLLNFEECLNDLSLEELITENEAIKDTSIIFDSAKRTITGVYGSDQKQIATTDFRMAESIVPSAKKLNQQQLLHMCHIFKALGTTPQAIVADFLKRQGLDIDAEAVKIEDVKI